MEGIASVDADRSLLATRIPDLNGDERVAQIDAGRAQVNLELRLITGLVHGNGQDGETRARAGWRFSTAATVSTGTTTSELSAGTATRGFSAGTATRGLTATTRGLTATTRGLTATARGLTATARGLTATACGLTATARSSTALSNNARGAGFGQTRGSAELDGARGPAQLARTRGSAERDPTRSAAYGFRTGCATHQRNARDSGDATLSFGSRYPTDRHQPTSTGCGTTHTGPTDATTASPRTATRLGSAVTNSTAHTGAASPGTATRRSATGGGSTLAGSTRTRFLAARIARSAVVTRAVIATAGRHGQDAKQCTGAEQSKLCH